MHPLAIATGNAIIIKPASSTPSAALLTGELYKQAGLPDGIYQVLTGNRNLVTSILEHPGIDAISFVGSTPVAHIVQDTGVAHGKRVQALGGANNHAIVMPDADIDQIHVDQGMVEGCEMGPVIDKKAQERIEGLITDAEERGATIVRDGRGFRPEGYPNGYFVGPTIIDNCPKDAPAYYEEIFGPVLVITRADTYEEAIEIVNSSPFGNGSAIFTNDGGVARKFTLEAEAGMVGVNVPIPTPVAYYSFGGWKDSLLGDTHIHGPEGVKFYTKAKAITTRWPSESGHYEATMSFQREEG